MPGQSSQNTRARDYTDKSEFDYFLIGPKADCSLNS